MNQLLLAAWAAIIGSSVFVVVFTLEGAIRAGYEPRAMHISALSLGPRGWIQVSNFVMLGLMLGVVALGVGTGSPGEWVSGTGVILLGAIAVLFVVSGLFVMDSATAPQGELSGHGMIHGLAGGVVFLLMPIVMFVFMGGFAVDREWRVMQTWSLVLGIVDALAVLSFILASKLPALQARLARRIGLIQRAALLPFMIWVFVFGLELLRVAKQR